jgi:hypothetical protein
MRHFLCKLALQPTVCRCHQSVVDILISEEFQRFLPLHLLHPASVLPVEYPEEPAGVAQKLRPDITSGLLFDQHRDFVLVLWA